MKRSNPKRTAACLGPGESARGAVVCGPFAYIGTLLGFGHGSASQPRSARHCGGWCLRTCGMLARSVVTCSEVAGSSSGYIVAHNFSIRKHDETALIYYKTLSTVVNVLCQPEELDTAVVLVASETLYIVNRDFLAHVAVRLVTCPAQHDDWGSEGRGIEGLRCCSLCCLSPRTRTEVLVRPTATGFVTCSTDSAACGYIERGTTLSVRLAHGGALLAWYIICWQVLIYQAEISISWQKLVRLCSHVKRKAARGAAFCFQSIGDSAHVVLPSTRVCGICKLHLGEHHKTVVHLWSCSESRPWEPL